MSTLFAFLGPVEWVVIGIVVLLLFGNRLPALMGSLGRSVVEFKKGIKEVESDADKSDRSR